MNRVFSIVLVAAMVGGCSRLAVFDAVVPKDWNAKRIVSGINFGPDARQKLDIYLPDNRKPTKVVIFVYGGSWNSGSRNEYAFVGRALASRGFATVIADNRLASLPGFRNRHGQGGSLDPFSYSGIWRRPQSTLPRGPFSRRLQRDDGCA